MGEQEMKALGNWMADVIEAPGDEALQARIASDVAILCDRFPAPGVLG